MNGKRKQSWSVSELVLLILPGLVGLNILLAIPARLSSFTPVPKTPRLSPNRPPPTNKFMLKEGASRRGIKLAWCAAGGSV